MNLSKSRHALVRSKRILLDRLFDAWKTNGAAFFIGRSEDFEERFVEEAVKLSFLRTYLSNRDYRRTQDKLWDVGTGIGFPGFFLCIFEGIRVILVENNSKKYQFLNKVNFLNLEIRKTTLTLDSIFNQCRRICGRASLKLRDLIRLSRAIRCDWIISWRQMKELSEHRSFFLMKQNTFVGISLNVPRGTRKKKVRLINYNKSI